MKTFEANKNATELGIDTTRKFIVVNSESEYYKVGDIVELIEDDNREYTRFLLNGKTRVIYWKDLYYAHNTIVAHGQVFQKVYVSDTNIEDALERKRERILLHTLPGGKKDKYIVVNNGCEDDFMTGGHYGVSGWVYMAEIPISPTTKKVTVTIDGEQNEIEMSEEELNKLLNR